MLFRYTVHDDRRDTREDAAADQAGDPQAKSPASQRVLLIGTRAETTPVTTRAVAPGLLVELAVGVGTHVAHRISPCR